MALYPFCIILASVGIGIRWSDTTLIFHRSTADSTPGVKGIANLLFYLERNPDANAVCYTVKLDAHGRINQNDPIDVFWFRYNRNPAIRNLNLVQKKLAYGVKTRLVTADEYEVSIVSFPQRILTLKRFEDGPYQIFTSIDGQEAVLSNVYVKFKSANTAPPVVEYIDLFGKCNVTGKPSKERILIKE